MNCKQGDMAMVVSDYEGFDEKYPGVLFKVHTSGYVVKCEALTTWNGHPAWVPEGEVVARVTHSRGQGNCVVLCIEDSVLRPLPPLNDSESLDELLELPAPITEPA